jgi:site-specific recombinase XerC
MSLSGPAVPRFRPSRSSTRPSGNELERHILDWQAQPAGQRVLDATQGNLKAVQKLLGHSSISTTGDIYTDWDIDQLAETLRGMLEESER